MKEQTPVAILDPDLEELIPGYLENRRNELQVLQEALQQRNFVLLQRTGHTLKGSGYGFEKINAMGRLMEDAAKGERIEELQAILEELEDYVLNVQVVYED